MDALGLNSLDCLGLQIDLSDKSLSLSSAFFVNKYEGIFSLMEDNGKKANLHSFVPTNLMTASSVRYDLSKLWPKVEEMMREISPQLLLLVNSQIQAFEDQIGVPFRKKHTGVSWGRARFFFPFECRLDRKRRSTFSDEDELDELKWIS